MLKNLNNIKKHEFIHIFTLFGEPTMYRQSKDVTLHFEKGYIRRAANISMPVTFLFLQLSEISTLPSRTVLLPSSLLRSHLSVTGSVTLLALSHTNDDSDVTLSYTFYNGQNPGSNKLRARKDNTVSIQKGITV